LIGILIDVSFHFPTVCSISFFVLSVIKKFDSNIDLIMKVNVAYAGDG